MQMWFEMRGSGAETYRVEVIARGSTLLMDCTCQAGARGIHCKHRFALLEGDGTLIIDASHNAGDVVAAAQGSKVLALLQSLRQQEAEADQIAKEIAKTKKQIAREMMG